MLKECIIYCTFWDVIPTFAMQSKTKKIEIMHLSESCDSTAIARYVETNYVGIRLEQLSRVAIGYVQRGEKHIYYGDSRHIIQRGELFYLGIGNHYIENIPEEGKGFEQIVIYYSPQQIQRILLQLNMSFSIDISNSHSCEKCSRMNHVAMPSSSVLRNFFSHVASYLHDENLMQDQAAENIKMTELIYTIISMPECCLRSKILSNADAAYGNFEQVIYRNVFRDISIEGLAAQTNRSLTSFKKEFKRHFNVPPHRWFIHQRLMQSRLLLISTLKSISEIGVECTFPNPSHFIKLFKKEFDVTPAVYRARYGGVLFHKTRNECSHDMQMRDTTDKVAL